ncbi:MAG: agmatine deiminase family protein [Gammaproteobacteria bacterium]
MNRTLPAEWAPQSGVMLIWPHRHSDWAPLLDRVEPVFASIARAVSQHERVLIVCFDDAHARHVKDVLTRAGALMDRIRLHCVASNDTWARDHGPVTVLENGQPRLLDFIFNGWGGKFDATLDNRMTARLHSAGAFGASALRAIDLVLEGGSIESDGAGTLLTTAQCLLTPTRNPQYDRSDIEGCLRQILGVERFLWLEHGYLAGDDTDSHIDTLARFCSIDTIAYVTCDDPGDEHYVELKAMEAELAAFRTHDDKPYRLVPLPWPQACFDGDGRRLPATYANFLIINGAVLMPSYDDPADGRALANLATCFPDREFITIPCLPLIQQYGSLHCVTMQLPAGVSLS